MKIKMTVLLLITALLGIVIASGIMVYPLFMDSFNDIKQTINISGYDSGLEQLSIEEKAQIFSKAEEYNNAIWASQKSGSPFRYQGAQSESSEYKEILNVSEISDVMAYIEIPSIGVYLPITHGTNAEKLKYQIGHLFGTSVPIGGMNTHCVLAGHTGLQNADLFTDIIELKLGDVIYIHVLGEIHVYVVCEMNTVLPESADNFLQIEEGRDLVTLYTCTPKGLNNKRLLVKCDRTYPDLAADDQSGEQGTLESYKTSAIIKTVLLGLIPFVVSGAGVFMLIRGKRKIQ